MKTIPKSLHTIRAVAIMAQMIQANSNFPVSDQSAVEFAFNLLGYEGAPDDHGLIPKTVAALQKLPKQETNQAA